MKPRAAIASAYRRSFDYSGRSVRSEFWWFAAYEIFVVILIQFLDGAIFDATIFSGPGEFTPLTQLFLLLNLLPWLPLTIRRLRDVGLSGSSITGVVVGQAAASYVVLAIALVGYGMTSIPTDTGLWLDMGLLGVLTAILIGAALPTRKTQTVETGVAP